MSEENVDYRDYTWEEHMARQLSPPAAVAEVDLQRTQTEALSGMQITVGHGTPGQGIPDGNGDPLQIMAEVARRNDALLAAYDPEGYRVHKRVEQRTAEVKVWSGKADGYRQQIQTIANRAGNHSLTASMDAGAHREHLRLLTAALAEAEEELSAAYEELVVATRAWEQLLASREKAA